MNTVQQVLERTCGNYDDVLLPSRLALSVPEFHRFPLPKEVCGLSPPVGNNPSLEETYLQSNES